MKNLIKIKQFILNPDNSLSLGKVIDISIDVHFSWLFIFSLLLYSLSTNYYASYASIPASWTLGFISAILLFTSIVLHELSHSIFARRYGIEVKRILLFMFGGVANIKSEPQKPLWEFIIAISGPICSFIISAIFGLLFLSTTFTHIKTLGFWQIIDIALMVKLNHILKTAPFLAGLFFYISFVNLLLGLFNLVPAFPMDGGRILRSLIWTKTGNLLRATYIASLVSKIIAIIFALFGGYLLFEEYFLIGIWHMIMATFLYRTARTSYKRLLSYHNFQTQ